MSRALNRFELFINRFELFIIVGNLKARLLLGVHSKSQVKANLIRLGRTIDKPRIQLQALRHHTPEALAMAGIERLSAAFSSRNASGKPAFVAFLTAGYPSLASTVPSMLAAHQPGLQLKEVSASV